MRENFVLTLNRHTFPGSLALYKYHGQGRQEESYQLFQNNVVLTTYATVSNESRRGQSILRSVEWFRIVLDEGKHHPVQRDIDT